MGRNYGGDAAASGPMRFSVQARQLGVFISLLPTLLLLPFEAQGAGPVVAFLGDSLTSGHSLPQSVAYPALLERSLGITAINAGVSGNMTADGLARLARDVLVHQPQIVVVELGINDHLRRLPAESSLRNLDEIARRIRQTGARLVLLHVSPVFGPDPLLRGLRDLARRYQAVLVEDLLRGIITEPDLRVDRLHPNARGHQKMADRLRPVLAKLLRSL